MKSELKGSTATSISIQYPSLLNAPPHTTTSPDLSGALKGCLGSLDGACIEKLLLHCASALESNDVTLAQQVMWVLNNVASPLGDTNQRLTSCFLRALVSRASRVCPVPMSFNGRTTCIQRRLMSVTELAGYVDLIPWHSFGFSASNSAIFKAIHGFPRVHILDFSITHCMQWPTLIDALAKRPQGPPHLKITLPSTRPPVPPLVNISTQEVGLRLANFAKFRNVVFEFNVIGQHSTSSELISNVNNNEYYSSSFQFESLLSQLNAATLNLREDEALVINCQNWLRYLSDERKGSFQNSASARDSFINLIKSLNPRIVLLVDEDCDLSAPSLTSRITTCFNYLWIPFDALETFLPKDSRQRVEYECDIGQKIENSISFEGVERIERLESGVKMSQRMKNGGFFSVPFCDETVREVKGLLDEHASGWGMKREEDMLVLTWKGHNSVFATAWVPNETTDDHMVVPGRSRPDRRKQPVFHRFVKRLQEMDRSKREKEKRLHFEIMELNCNLEVDINGEETFIVDKNIVGQYSGKFIKLFGKNNGVSRKLKVIFHDFPGGASGFELILRFVYNNGKSNITPSNLLLAHSAAKFMEMKESVNGNPNLLEQTEKSLQDMSYWTWSDLLITLKQCQDLTLFAGCSSMMLERCLESLVGRLILASEASPCPSTCSTESYNGFRFSCESKSTESVKTSTFSRSSWWFEDLVFLCPLLVQMLVKAMLWRKLEHVIISRFLMYYQKAKFSTATTDEKRKIIEMVIDMHYSMDQSVVSCKTLFGILRITLSLNISKCIRNKLENMIGGHLDQATLDNLLVPSPYGISYLYDVNLILRFLKSFLRRGNCLVGPGPSRMRKVGSLMDLYIAEIAPDPCLKPSKFLALVTALPDSARDSYDELYHAVDMYLEVHGGLSEEERVKICCSLNYEKLSTKACLHLSQNTKFPSRSAVQALVVQQSKLKTLLLSTPSTTPFTVSPRSCSDVGGTKNRTSEQVVLYSGKFQVSKPGDKLSSHLQGIQWRVSELENICRKLQTQMAKMMRSRVSGHSYSRSLPKLCS
ncbi:BTB/POZ domain-containing protein [Senna tora]|uniref:BTB/POZ domain-containing protein n=1 Tax=Senna tora TaxID=362788 RepID=A0A834W4S8_9FABA|nr:BTB/POZ domain-containing protein [Senna tora]